MLGKISCRKCYETSRIFVIESFFNQIAGINSKSAPLLKRSFHQGGFPVNILKFSALMQKSLTCATCIDKITGCALQG